MPFAGRGARLDQTVTLWRQTWDGQGEFADALPAARSGGPPVWLAGGDTAKVIERVSTTYDGWLPYFPDVNAYARAWDRIRAQAVREVTPALYATVNLNDDKARANEELNEYLRAYYGQPLDVMGYVQAIRGGSVAECLDWLARYVDAARHLIVRIGSLTARPESVAEQLLPALKELGRP
jgi:alkanesulfonate monooxygenase SsuD/methylene tetrahydromethanopterin reductase-like flavin-dependent oxidoreductase (luciferase family)